jgi:hypothetical protein
MDQTFRDFEIILYDDRSTDGTADLLERFRKQYPDVIRVHCAEANMGIGAGKNYGVTHARGRYVAFIDQDDSVDDDYFEQLAQTAAAHPDADIIISGFKRVDARGDTLYTRAATSPHQAFRQIVPLWAKLYKRDFLIQNDIRSPIGAMLEDVLHQTSVAMRAPTSAIAPIAGYRWLQKPISVSNTVIRGFRAGESAYGIRYLTDLKQHAVSKESADELDYGVFLFAVWHLMKSGAHADARQMREEYDKTFPVLMQAFPGCRTCPLIAPTRPKGNRRIVSLTLWIVRLLWKCKLSKLFFTLYAALGLSRLWPKL